jgi:hypothetical protein
MDDEYVISRYTTQIMREIPTIEDEELYRRIWNKVSNQLGLLKTEIEFDQKSKRK